MVLFMKAMICLPGYNDIVEQSVLKQSTLPAGTYRICILHDQIDSQKKKHIDFMVDIIVSGRLHYPFSIWLILLIRARWKWKRTTRLRSLHSYHRFEFRKRMPISILDGLVALHFNSRLMPFCAVSKNIKRRSFKFKISKHHFLKF